MLADLFVREPLSLSVMDIQFESMSPCDPLASLDEDYEKAVLHLAWSFDRSSKTRTLLFAWIELLPTEIPPPIDDYDPRNGFRLGGGSNHRIYIRHVVISARRAIAWYRSCLDGKAIMPENDGTFSDNEPGGKVLSLSDLDEEPKWPALILALDDGESLPFVPEWMQCPRTHHLLPRSPFDLAAIIVEECEREKLHDWLAARLHFELRDYPEYWGSIHLVAPNPVYRRLETSRTQPNGSLLFTFHLREGKSVDGLRLAVRNIGPWGSTRDAVIFVRKRWIRISGVGNGSSIEVWDPRRGALETCTQATLRGFEGEVSISHRLVVKTRNGSFEVDRRGEPQRFFIGEAGQGDTARARLYAGREARRKQAAGAALGQQWFRGEKKKARKLLRILLNEADKFVLFIDPYVRSDELLEFMAISLDNITVRILTSETALKGKGERERFAQQLEAMRRQPRMNPFDVRVMRKDRPAVHDRFLCIDDRIWMLGSSLNEFGSRGTMLLALPYPEGVRGDLERAWDEAMPLNEWLAKRAAAKATAVDPEATSDSRNE